MFKLDLEKAEELEIKLQTSTRSSKKKGSSRKISNSALLTLLHFWLCGSQQTVENSERDGNNRPPDLPLEKSDGGQEATGRTEHATTDWFQIGKEHVKAVYCHPAYSTYMQSTSRETLGWMKHKLESRLGTNINNFRYADDTTLMAESEELKSLLMKVK